MSESTVIAIRKVQGTVNLRESARTFYILTANLLFFCRFSVNYGQLTVFYRIYGIFPGKFAAGKCPVFSNYGAFPGSKFSGEYTVNPVKYGQLPVNLRKICKRTVNWPLIYKMYGHFPVNSRFTVLFLSQLPITRSVKLRLPLASINSNECTALQLLTLAWFLNFILHTKYECTVIQKTGVLIVQWFKSENSLGSVDS